MIARILKRAFRQPVSALAVILFAAVLSVVLCYLQQAEQKEIRSFEETYLSVPVYFQVTDLDGSRPDRTKPIEGWAADLFFEDSKLSPDFSELVTDLQLRMSHVAAQGEDPKEEIAQREDLIGVTSLQVAEELTPAYGASIQWDPGFEETVFATNAFVCIVPEDHASDEEIVLSFTYKNLEQKIHRQYTCTFQIVGRHTDENNIGIYCPYSAIEEIYTKLGEPKKLEHISATLKDNSDLPLLRETAAHWFAKPDPLGEPTVWANMATSTIFTLWTSMTLCSGIWNPI